MPQILDPTKPLLVTPDEAFPPGFLESTKRGVGSGVQTIKGSGGETLAGLGRATGVNFLEQVGRDIASKASQAQAQYSIPTQKIEDVKSFSDVANLAGFHIGAQVPILATLAATRFGGGAAAARVGATKTQGQIAGLIAGDLPIQFAEGKSELREVGVSEEESDRAALAAAIPRTLLDVAPVELLFRRFGVDAGAGLVKRVSKSAALVGTAEALTEVGQEGIGALTRAIYDPEYDVAGEEAQSRYLNAAFAAFISGGAIAGATAIPAVAAATPEAAAPVDSGQPTVRQGVTDQLPLEGIDGVTGAEAELQQFDQADLFPDTQQDPNRPLRAETPLSLADDISELTQEEIDAGVRFSDQPFDSRQGELGFDATLPPAPKPFGPSQDTQLDIFDEVFETAPTGSRELALLPEIPVQEPAPTPTARELDDRADILEQQVETQQLRDVTITPDAVAAALREAVVADTAVGGFVTIDGDPQGRTFEVDTDAPTPADGSVVLRDVDTGAQIRIPAAQVPLLQGDGISNTARTAITALAGQPLSALDSISDANLHPAHRKALQTVRERVTAGATTEARTEIENLRAQAQATEVSQFELEPPPSLLATATVEGQTIRGLDGSYGPPRPRLDAFDIAIEGTDTPKRQFDLGGDQLSILDAEPDDAGSTQQSLFAEDGQVTPEQLILNLEAPAAVQETLTLPKTRKTDGVTKTIRGRIAAFNRILHSPASYTTIDGAQYFTSKAATSLRKLYVSVDKQINALREKTLAAQRGEYKRLVDSGVSHAEATRQSRRSHPRVGLGRETLGKFAEAFGISQVHQFETTVWRNVFDRKLEDQTAPFEETIFEGIGLDLESRLLEVIGDQKSYLTDGGTGVFTQRAINALSKVLTQHPRFEGLIGIDLKSPETRAMVARVVQSLEADTDLRTEFFKQVQAKAAQDLNTVFAVPAYHSEDVGDAPWFSDYKDGVFADPESYNISLADDTNPEVAQQSAELLRQALFTTRNFKADERNYREFRANAVDGRTESALNIQTYVGRNVLSASGVTRLSSVLAEIRDIPGIVVELKPEVGARVEQLSEVPAATVKVDSLNTDAVKAVKAILDRSSKFSGIGARERTKAAAALIAYRTELGADTPADDVVRVNYSDRSEARYDAAQKEIDALRTRLTATRAQAAKATDTTTKQRLESDVQSILGGIEAAVARQKEGDSLYQVPAHRKVYANPLTAQYESVQNKFFDFENASYKAREVSDELGEYADSRQKVLTDPTSAGYRYVIAQPNETLNEHIAAAQRPGSNAVTVAKAALATKELMLRKLVTNLHVPPTFPIDFIEYADARAVAVQAQSGTIYADIVGRPSAQLEALIGSYDSALNDVVAGRNLELLERLESTAELAKKELALRSVLPEIESAVGRSYSEAYIRLQNRMYASVKSLKRKGPLANTPKSSTAEHVQAQQAEYTASERVADAKSQVTQIRGLLKAATEVGAIAELEQQLVPAQAALVEAQDTYDTAIANTEALGDARTRENRTDALDTARSDLRMATKKLDDLKANPSSEKAKATKAFNVAKQRVQALNAQRLELAAKQRTANTQIRRAKSLATGAPAGSVKVEHELTLTALTDSYTELLQAVDANKADAVAAREALKELGKSRGKEHLVVIAALEKRVVALRKDVDAARTQLSKSLTDDEKSASFDDVTDALETFKSEDIAELEADTFEDVADSIHADVQDEYNSLTQMSEELNTPADTLQKDIVNAAKIVEAIERMLGAGRVQIKTPAKDKNAGSYDPVESIISVALNAVDSLSVAAHEAYHAAYFKILTSREKVIVRNAFKQGSPLRKQLEQIIRTTQSEADVEAIIDSMNSTPSEAEAYAFQFWKSGQLQTRGVVSNVLGKIRQFFERVANYIRQAGFNTDAEAATAIFNALDAGKLASRSTVESDTAHSESLRETAASIENNVPITTLYSQTGTINGTNPDLADEVQAAADNIPESHLRNWLAGVAPSLKGDSLATKAAHVWGSTFSSMQNLARYSPASRAVFNIVRKMAARRDTIISEESEALFEFAGDGFFGFLKKRNGVSDATRSAVSKAIFAGTNRGVVFDDVVLRDEFGLTPDQIGWYKKIRSSIDRLLTMNYEAQAKKAEARGDDATAKQLRGELGALLNAGYFPKRRYGKHRVLVKFKGESQPLALHLSENRQEQETIAKHYETTFANNPDVEVTKDYQNKEVLIEHSIEFNAFLDRLSIYEAKGLVVSEEVRRAMYRDMTASISKLSKQRRLDITGEDRDVVRTLADFVGAQASAITSYELSAELDNAVVTGKWHDEANGNFNKEKTISMVNFIRGTGLSEDETGEIGGTLRAAAAMAFLGGNISHALIQMSQIVMATAPMLVNVTSMSNTYSSLLKGLKDSAHFRFADIALMQQAVNRGKGLGNLSADELAAMLRANEDGTTQAQQIFAVAGIARGKLLARASTARQAANAWMQPFVASEEINRRTTFLAAYRIGKQLQAEGKPLKSVTTKDDVVFDDLYDFAKHTVDETQFIYTRANRPNFARNPLGAVLFTFKSYPVFMTELFAALPAKGQRTMIGTLLLASGTSGLFFSEDLFDLIDTLTQATGVGPIDTQHYMKQVLDDMGNSVGVDDFGDLAMYGLLNPALAQIPGFGGIDIGGRLGLGNIIPGTDIAQRGSELSQVAADIGGPVGALVKGGFEAAGAFVRGDVETGLSKLPISGIKNAAKAGYWIGDDYVARNVRGAKSAEVTGWQAMFKALGFSPLSVSKQYRLDKSISKSQSYIGAVTADYKAELVRAVNRRDHAKQRELYDSIADWNRSHPEPQNQLNITRSSIHRAVKRGDLTPVERRLKGLSKKQRTGFEDEVEDLLADRL